MKEKLCRPRDSDKLPFQLPNLKINNCEIKQSSSIKFLGLLIDENLTWVDHITIVANTFSKNIGLYIYIYIYIYIYKYIYISIYI